MKRKTKAKTAHPAQSVADEATAAYLAALAALDTTAATLLKAKETKTTAKAMILRERRELAVHIARVRGVDVDGKRDPAIPPGEGDQSPAMKTGLLIDLSNVPPEMREKIIARQLANGTDVAN